MIDNNKVQISFYGTEELRRRLKRVAAERGVFVQDIIDEAIAKVLADPGGFSTRPTGTVGERQRFAKGSENLHLMLDFVYESGPERLSAALMTTLDAYAQVTHAYVSREGITSASAASDDDETDTLLIEAREATARARRVIHTETGTDPGDAGRAETAAAGIWRKQA